MASHWLHNIYPIFSKVTWIHCREVSCTVICLQCCVMSKVAIRGFHFSVCNSLMGECYGLPFVLACTFCSNWIPSLHICKCCVTNIVAITTKWNLTFQPVIDYWDTLSYGGVSDIILSWNMVVTHGFSIVLQRVNKQLEKIRNIKGGGKCLLAYLQV